MKTSLDLVKTRNFDLCEAICIAVKKGESGGKVEKSLTQHQAQLNLGPTCEPASRLLGLIRVSALSIKASAG